MSLYVAIDHRSESIQRHLPHPATGASFRQFRRIVATMAMKGVIDGLVIAPEDFSWAADNFNSRKLILGLPDQSNIDELAKNLIPTVNDISLQPLAVKVGFSLTGTTTEVRQAIHVFTELCGKNYAALNWILEPYFSRTLSIDLRCEFMEHAAKIEQVMAFKLDLENPEEFAEHYTKAAGDKPWFARSDGMAFSTFCQRLKIAVEYGCSGAIVGAAIWSEAAPVVASHGNAESAEGNILSKLRAVKEILPRV